MKNHDIANNTNQRHTARWTIALSGRVASDQHLVDTLRQLPSHLIVGHRPQPPDNDFHLTPADEPAPPQGRGRHVIVTADTDETALRAAMRRGAAAAIPRDVTCEAAQVVFAAVAAGYFPIPRHLATALATRLEPPSATALTDRDRIILDHLAHGDTIRTIAQRLGCSERHTRRHLHTLWDSMGVSGRAQGLVAAVRQGLLNP